MAQMPNIAVTTVDVFGCLLDRHVVRAGISDGFFARRYFPLAPRRDDLQARSERFCSQLEANLIVTFASATVRQGIRADFFCNFNLTLGQQGTREGSAEQIFVFVNGAGA